ILALSTCLALVQGASGQTVSDNLDDGDDSDWSGYDGAAATDVPPTPSRVRSFPNDPACGGKYYRILLNGSQSAAGGFPRGGSIRSDTTAYIDTFAAVDVVSWDEAGMSGGTQGSFLGTRLTTPGSLSTEGYIFVYL